MFIPAATCSRRDKPHHATRAAPQGGGGGAQYAAATAGEGRADVRLHNPDAELDFEDRVADHDDGTAAGACACM